MIFEDVSIADAMHEQPALQVRIAVFVPDVMLQGGGRQCGVLDGEWFHSRRIKGSKGK